MDDPQTLVDRLVAGLPNTSPDVAALVASGRAARQRRRRVAVVGAAVVVLLAMAGIGVGSAVIGGSGGHDPAPAGDPETTRVPSPGMQVVGEVGVTVQVPLEWQQVAHLCGPGPCPLTYASPDRSTSVDVLVSEPTQAVDRMDIIGRQAGVEVRTDTSSCELSRPGGCLRTVAVPARRLTVRVSTEDGQLTSEDQAILDSIVVGPVDVSGAGNTLSGRDLEIAVAAAREVVAGHPAAETELAFASVRAGKSFDSNTGHPCTSGRIVTVTVVGSYPDVVTTGLVALPGTNPIANMGIHSLIGLYDAVSGQQCLGSVAVWQPSPGPQDTVLELGAARASTTSAPPPSSAPPLTRLDGPNGVSLELPDGWISGGDPASAVGPDGEQLQVTDGDEATYDALAASGQPSSIGGLEAFSKTGICETSLPPYCSASLAVPARDFAVKLIGGSNDGDALLQSWLRIGRIDTSSAGDDLTGRELDLATTAARRQVATYPTGAVEVAYASAHDGTRPDSNTGHQCYSGRIIRVTMLGNIPALHGGIGDGDGVASVENSLGVHLVGLVVDGTSGEVCVLGVGTREPPPGPHDTVLDLN